MFKNRFAIAFISIAVLFTISCDKNKDGLSGNSKVFSLAEGQFADNEIEYEDYSFIDAKDFFNLDYRPEKAEEPSVPGKVRLESPEPSNEKSTSFIPGLRPLNKYKTKYHEKRVSDIDYEKYVSSMKSEAKKEAEKRAKNPAKSDFSEEEFEKERKSTDGMAMPITDEKTDESGPLVIKDWGPKDLIPSSIKNPEFYVEFSHPVIALAALSNPEKYQKEAGLIMSISPQIRGKYIWYGTRNLSFEAAEPLDPLVEYTVTISSSVKSIGGQKLSGSKSFTAKSAVPFIVDILPGESAKKDTTKNIRYSDEAGLRLEIVDILSGESAKKDAIKNIRYSDEAGLRLEDAKFFKVRFNGYLTQESAKNLIKVSMEDSGQWSAQPLSFSIIPDYSKENGNESMQDALLSNSFYITILSPLQKDHYIAVESYDALNNTFHKKGYFTERPFILKESYNSSGYLQTTVSWTFRFNKEIDKTSVKNAVSVEGIKLDDANFSIYGKTLTLQFLKIPPEEERKITISKNLRDIYGANLEKEIQDNVKGRHISGYARFIDSGTKMLESQFPHKLIFEYMNANAESAYRLSKSTDPLYTPGWQEYWTSEKGGGTFFGGSTKENIREFQEIDLEPYLTNGKGNVMFEADIKTLQYEYDSIEYTPSKNFLNLQVTDLGATVRFGINKAVVMVRTLSTDKPVIGAKVYLRSYSPEKRGLPSDSALTDENGLAVINGDKRYQSLFESDYDENYIAVVVESNGDKITFRPNDHWAWGIPRGYINEALTEKPRTFMFVDRGVYKPGETVTFRGIDRNQQMGSFVPFAGKYTVTLEKNSWNDSSIYGMLQGTTSASGGFWGKFSLPKELEPGRYRIKYKRGTKTYASEVSFTVAYYEKLKIQGAVTTEEKDIYAGDSVKASVNASYLAGGYLAHQPYAANWYTEPATFSPSAKELEKFKFGINSYWDDDYEGRKYVASDSSLLSSKGTAELSCSTEGNMKGTPYIYRVEVDVTDESNQKITLSSSKFVNPAMFYIGIGPVNGKGGFAKTKKEMSIPLVMVSPDEKIIEDMSISSSAIEYTFTRHYWTYDIQNSVDDSLYKRYTEHHETEAKGSIKASPVTKLNLVPQKAGYYTLTVSGTDSKGRISTSSRDFYISGSDASCFFSDDDTSLKLTPDKNLYNPGETAQVLLESPLEKGDYLICVEREGIFTQEIRHIPENTTVIDVPVARNYVPVCYVTVSSYSVRKGKPTHEYGERDMDKPKGYYGATMLFVNPLVRAFSIQAETDSPVYRPGDTATVNIKATKAGKPLANSEITVMAVDRAVLDLIDYHVPNPIKFFYDEYNFRLRVSGGDSRAYLMDPVTYSIKNLQGGDEDDDKDEDERKDFRPTALFEPSIITDKDGNASVSFRVPDSLTTYRLTAFGVNGELLAIQENEFAVQNPINVQAVQPRRLRERDTAECGVILTNLDANSHEVEVSVSIRSPKSNSPDDETMGLLTKAGSAFIDGETVHTVKVAGGQTSAVYFDIAAQDDGDIELVYRIKSGVLKERLVSRLTIEKTYCMETVALQGSTDSFKGKSVSAAEEIVIPSFAEDGKGSLSVTLDATRLGLLGSAVNYVFDYPYGCLEQQSSKILPLVMFEEYIDVFGLNSKIKNTKRCVISHFKNWKNEQLDDGGFPYWPGTKTSSLYVSLRMAHIYATAMNRGYKHKDFPIDIENLLSYIKTEIIKNSESKGKNGLSGNTAYALYVFSMLDDNSLDSLYPLFEEEAKKDHYIGALTALSYMNKGGNKNIEKARYLAERIRMYMRPNLRSVDITDPIGYRNSSIFHTDIDKTAEILKLFTRINPNDEMVDRLVYNLLSECQNGYWASTATTSNILEAFNDVIKGRNLDYTDFKGKATIENITFSEGSFKGAGAKPITVKREFEGSVLSSLNKDEPFLLKFSANGTGKLYYNAELKYALPDETISKRNNGFDVRYTIYDTEKKNNIEPNTGNLVYSLKSGTTYKITVTVSSTMDAYNVALRIPIPSGAEILDPRFKTSGSVENESIKSEWWTSLSNSVIYDNEFQCFWDNFKKGEHEVSFLFRAARRGVYPVTPALAECMYSAERFGRSDGYIYTIE